MKDKDLKNYRPFERLKFSDFQVVRLAFTPRCCFTVYQMALERLLSKSKAKIIRELEISTLLRRVRESDKLCKSFEKVEFFYGLRKKYKNEYINVVNVSMDT